MKPVKLTQHKWNDIRKQLQQEHPASVFMLRSRMRAVLGFTVREHRAFMEDKGHYVLQVHLDFYSEKKRTLFILKFSELVDNKELA